MDREKLISEIPESEIPESEMPEIEMPIEEDSGLPLTKKELEEVKRKQELKKDVERDCITNNLEYFIKKIELNKTRSVPSTGWPMLDDKMAGGLYPGLYSMGAISSLGKTAFCVQMADNLALSGQPVMFFSLEMPAIEIIARSISRLAFLDKNADKYISTNKVLMGKLNDNSFNKYTSEYFSNYGNLHLIQGDFGTNILSIESKISDFIECKQVRPIVFIDYLQVIKPRPEITVDGKEKYLNERQSIENVVVSLKQLSKQYSLTIIVVSSFNRASYGTCASFESFKESGLIEYTSDVVMGLQLIVDPPQKGEHDSTFKKRVNVAKAQNPRKLELAILKQRNGKSFVKQCFNFYPINNYFEEVEDILDE